MKMWGQDSALPGHFPFFKARNFFQLGLLYPASRLCLTICFLGLCQLLTLDLLILGRNLSILFIRLSLTFSYYLSLLPLSLSFTTLSLLFFLLPYSFSLRKKEEAYNLCKKKNKGELREEVGAVVRGGERKKILY